jgi:hypothetical protein
MYAHIQEQPPRPTETAPGLPAAFDDVVLKALAKEPGDRYQSAGELAAAAGEAAGGVEPETARRPPSTPAAPTVSTPLPGPPPAVPPPAASPSPPPSSPPPPSEGTRPAAAVAQSPAAAAPTSPPPPSAAPDRGGGGSRRGLLLGLGAVAAVAAIVVVVVLAMGGGDDDADTTTPDGALTAFLGDLADGDGEAACELMTPEARQQAVDAPGADCAASVLALSGADDEGKAEAIRTASFSVTPSGEVASGYIDLPDPQQATLGTAGTRQINVSLSKSGEIWLVADFSGFCRANNTFC